MNLSGGSFVSREFEGKYGAIIMPSDLVNKMKDTSLSPSHLKVMGLKPSLRVLNSEKKRASKGIIKMKDISMFPSYQRVELSSVKDHDIAHKSGGAENSSNESNTGPFNIVREKTVMGFKPSLMVLSREKKKLSKGFSGIVVRPGMVLLKNYLSINDQVMIVNKCRKLGLGEGGFYQPGYRDGTMMHLKMMCLGKHWEPQTCQFRETRLVDNAMPPKIPVEFNQLVEKAIKASQSLVKMKAEDEIPFMSPDICVVNFYTSTGRLGLHQDKGESEKSIRKGLPIVSFSIGDSAEFLYGDERDKEKAEKLVLRVWRCSNIWWEIKKYLSWSEINPSRYCPHGSCSRNKSPTRSSEFDF